MMSACTCATAGNFSGKNSALLVPRRMEHRVAIRDQWNESPLPGLKQLRPSLAGTYTAHVADSQRSLTATRCSQYSARADSQKRRSPVPFKSPAGPSCGGAHTERMACRRLVFNETKAPAMHNHIDIDYVHSRAIVREIGERLRASLKPEPQLPANLRMQIDRLRELEEQSPSIVPDAEHWKKPRR